MTMFSGNSAPKIDQGPESVIRPSLQDLIALNQSAASIGLVSSRSRALHSGQYLSAIKGRGMEFDESRLYCPGDDVRNLDWRVTARTGKAHTKLFREERERPVFLSVDYRNPMFFATRGMYKSAMAARLAALIAWSAMRHDDRIGGQIFSEDQTLELRPAHGQVAVLRLLSKLVELSKPASGINSSGKVMDEALLHLPRHARPGSLVFIFSDFRQLSEAGEASLSRLSRHCDGVLVMIHDPFEQQIPPGRRRYQDGSGERVINADNAVRAEYAGTFQSRLERIEQVARRYGLRFISCSTAESPLAVLQRGGLRYTQRA